MVLIICIVLITGPSAGGVGAQAALDIASSPAPPARLILAGRTKSKIDPVIQEIAQLNSDIRVDFVTVDLSSQQSIRNAAKEISNLASGIDVIINNAGIMAVQKYGTTTDGIEKQFGTNHVGPFLLTNLLMPLLLRASAGARIINCSSNGYTLSGVRFDDYNFKDGADYNAWLAYGQSKTALLLFSRAIAKNRTLMDKNVSSIAVTPGLILESNLQNEIAPEMFQEGIALAAKVFEGREPPPEEKPKPMVNATSTCLVASLSPEVEGKNGGYMENCQFVKEDRIEAHAKGDDKAEKLWKLSEELVGEEFAW